MPDEKPLLMCGEMVRQTLAGVKTHTRRIVNPQPTKCHHDDDSWIWKGHHTGLSALALCHNSLMVQKNPYGQPGDRLWVRETHAWADELVDGTKREDAVVVAYRADKKILRREAGKSVDESDETWNLDHPCLKWRPSIFMPRWASRLTLEIVSVRVERVQEITEPDAEREGVTPKYPAMPEFIPAFARLWDSLNKDRGYGWDVNPYVWVLTFKKL